MYFKNLYLLALFLTVNNVYALGQTSAQDTIKFYDAHQFKVIGKFHSERNYSRLPEKYKKTVRKDVWELSQNSAGISIRFYSNASTIKVKWTLTHNYDLPHMASTGVKGVDLYAYVNNQWQFIRTGFPSDKLNEYTLLQKGDEVYREYLLNLPLYDGVDSLAIGVNTNAVISLPKEHYLLDKKPVVHYGTSIVQGACASRPGTAFTNILSRKLDRSFINLGFSGDGKIELSIGKAMAEIDAALYIIDCNSNTPKDSIYERMITLVKFLKDARPHIPILLVEGFPHQSSFFDNAMAGQRPIEFKNVESLRAFNTLKKDGINDLYYQKGSAFIGYDHEATVDGIHPTDLGMMRIAEVFLPTIKMILKQ